MIADISIPDFSNHQERPGRLSATLLFVLVAPSLSAPVFAPPEKPL